MRNFQPFREERQTFSIIFYKDDLFITRNNKVKIKWIKIRLQDQFQMINL